MAAYGAGVQTQGNDKILFAQVRHYLECLQFGCTGHHLQK
jgi:hypothetical protein